MALKCKPNKPSSTQVAFFRVKLKHTFCLKSRKRKSGREEGEHVVHRVSREPCRWLTVSILCPWIVTVKISGLRLHHLVFLLDHATRNTGSCEAVVQASKKNPWRVCGKEIFVVLICVGLIS